MSTVILVPGNCNKIDTILNDNNITFEKLNENYISIKEVLNDNIKKEISKIEHVYIVTNNGTLKNYIKLKEYESKEYESKEHQLKEHDIKEHDIKEHDIKEHKLKENKTYSYYPTDIAKIYNLPNLPSKLPRRVKIGIIQLGGGYRINDLTYYWNNVLKLPIIPIVNSISVDGATNNPGNLNIDSEVYLDIEIVGGICPNSIINVYFAPNSHISFIHAIQKAINDGNQVISISWGICEDYVDTYTLNAYDAVFQSAVKKGSTICVASGDNGYKDNGTTISVDFPASSPNVLSVGGTSLSATNNIYNNESAWNGSGGGYSKIFNKPNYQNVSNNKILSKSNFRCVPDICSNADPNTGYIIYINGKYYVIGGTSASAPMIASCLGRINYNKFLNNSLYNYIGSKFFHDIIIGTNGYNAIVGFDLVTGLGSPNFSNIPNGL